VQKSPLEKSSGDFKVKRFGAQEKTRTFTPLRELAPEASASTNFATWAGGTQSYPKRPQNRRTTNRLRHNFELKRGGVNPVSSF